MNIGNLVTGQTLIEAPAEENLYINDSQVVSYYMNYVKKDKYSSNIPNSISKVSFSDSRLRANDIKYKDLIDYIKGKNYQLRLTDIDQFQIY